MTTATITKKEIKSRVVYSQFRESLETSLVEIVTFENGYIERFDSFVSEVADSHWCTREEEKVMRKTTSQAKKLAFVNKYAQQFLSVGGRWK